MIESKVTCYAAKLHLNRSTNITRPERKANRGYAPTFEQVTQFPERMQNASQWPDLRGQRRADKPWLDMLPRLIFVSDMGDALSRKKEFLFLRREMKAVTSEDGRRHLWLWLTKRPRTMQQFADSIGGLPENVCAMTTVTSHATLDRVDELRAVNARVRGLSLEPLWSNIADRLDLTGIDWVIVGGESGRKRIVRPFPVEWAVALRDLCREQGVAFFLKQLGRQPTRNGEEFSLVHGHGGDQEEWDAALRVREFPEYFHNYRQPADAIASL